MAGRKIRDAQEAEVCLRAAEASGLTRREWARQRGIDGRSLQAWSMILKKRGQRREPVQQVIELLPQRVETPVRAGCRVVCGAFVVELEPD